MLNSMLGWDGIQKVACDGGLSDVSMWVMCWVYWSCCREDLRCCSCHCLSGPNFNQGTKKVRAKMQYHCIHFFPGPQA